MSSGVLALILLAAGVSSTGCTHGDNGAGPGVVGQESGPLAPPGLDVGAVREDVRRHVESKYQGRARSAVMQYAAALGHKLADADAVFETRLRRVTEMQRAIECLYHSLPAPEAQAARVEVRAQTLDGPEMTLAYARSDQGMGGQTFVRRSADAIDKSCIEADPAGLP